MAEVNCAACGKPAQGYKCDICDEEAAEHNPNHSHGGEHCMPKCTGCNEAEAKCTCTS